MNCQQSYWICLIIFTQLSIEVNRKELQVSLFCMKGMKRTSRSCVENLRYRLRQIHFKNAASLPDFQQTKALTKAGGVALSMSAMKASVTASEVWLDAGRYRNQNVTIQRMVSVLKYSCSGCQEQVSLVQPDVHYRY
jgi:hypothetical protein